MHHFIYPSKDTFITNRGAYDAKNFGVDEILKIGTKNTSTKLWRDTRVVNYATSITSVISVDAFTGTASLASLCGTASFVSGTITASVADGPDAFTASFFSGTFSGSYSGWSTGSAVSGLSDHTNIVDFSGSIYAYDIDGYVTGTLLAEANSFKYYTGQIISFNGLIYSGSYIIGKETKNEKNLFTTTLKYPNRALIQFNLTSISSSIASGDIATPEFVLNMKIAREEELPISYSIYAIPVNQYWEMGNGYYYDGGSDTGCSWLYTDYLNGTRWWPTNTSSLAVVDFITNPEQASGSWGWGGGTWYTSSAYFCSQSFNYQTSDISMSLQTIVLGWLSGSISNNGVILISSDEIASTGSQFDLSYFSRDTNTIYSPYLDAGWNDQTFTTGSVTLINQIYNVSSGSVYWFVNGGYLMSGSTDISTALTVSAQVSGSFGNCAPATITGNPGNISGEVTALTTAGHFAGQIIVGDVYGVISGSQISGTFTSGQLKGLGFSGSTTNIWTGYVSGSSFIAGVTGSYPISGSTIVGTANDQYLVVGTIGGFIITGLITGSYLTASQFLGMIQNGWAAGYYLSASVSGTYLTSSANTASIYSSRSLDSIQTGRPFAIVVQDVPSTVKSNNIVRIGVFGREQFPLKGFQRSTQLTQYLTPQHLPTSSYYALKDNETEQIIIDFDNYTKISCDENGNYFLLDTSCLPQERYYRILIKVEQSGSIYTFDHGNVFKVIR